jgi:hypothetical protein
MPGALDGEDEVLFDELADDPEEDDNVTEAGSPTVACEEEGDDTETSLPITVPFHSPPEKSVSSPETPENPPAQN